MTNTGLAEQLRERGVLGVGLDGMGSALPVASNDTEAGREKNRRVEVWLRYEGTGWNASPTSST